MANFNREEGEAICDIPLSRRQVPYLVYWKHSKDGNFIVKSAYKVARSLLKNEDWASSGGGVNRVWAAIWKLRIPNKMKVFGWRVCHDIHPTKRNLKKKRVLSEDLSLLEYLLDRMEKIEVELMMVQAWLIWNQRNRVVHGGKFLELGWLNKRVAELLEEFQRSQESSQADVVHGVARQVLQNNGTSWQPPPHSVYKLNYDAAMFANNTNSGFGAVIKN
ncbi:uncharacterized protein LOC112020143 [Quercus suber]|uniref:uncharacterized protein LOC112020143 n=1 Tax=Quercus suber TaxID=58331 RepID=UPI000CE17FB0|nr:uncharacterized protein LOC112020143 [Quercus suber]